MRRGCRRWLLQAAWKERRGRRVGGHCTQHRLLADSESLPGVAAGRPPSEGESRAELDLPARSGGFRDGGKLRSIHETVRRSQIDLVERVEEFRPELELGTLGEREFTSQSKIQRLHAGTVHRISAGIAEGERGWRGKRSGIEPFFGGTGACPEDRLARDIRSNGILAKDYTGIGGVAENRNRKRESTLSLVNRRKMPVTGRVVDDPFAHDGGKVIDQAHGEPVFDVAGKAFFRG